MKVPIPLSVPDDMLKVVAAAEDTAALTVIVEPLSVTVPAPLKEVPAFRLWVPAEN